MWRVRLGPVRRLGNGSGCKWGAPDAPASIGHDQPADDDYDTAGGGIASAVQRAGLRYTPPCTMTGDPRAERLAANEALFRTANERMAGWEEQHALSHIEAYFCECADTECREKVSLRKADYERVRANSRQFVVVPGHEIEDVEAVIERHDGWAIVEKPPEVSDTVERLDPRRTS